MPSLKYWTGSDWVAKALKYWNGSAWIEKALKYWDGDSWVGGVPNTALDAIKGGNPTFWDGKVIALVGDSTTDDVGPNDGFMAERLGAFTDAGQQLAGASILDDGWSGSTLREWLDDEVAYGITHTLAANPDVIVICHDINGVRSGGKSAAQLSEDLREAVTEIHAGRPDCIVILWTPNSFLSTDPTSSGFVTPLGSAQAYTDVLWTGYNDVVDEWPTYVAHLDKQTQTYGRTCQPTSALMADIIHPSPVGYDLDALQLVEALTPSAWPFEAADPFIADVVLILNGDAVEDAIGRHSVTSTGGGGDAVTSVDGFLNFPTVDAGLSVGDLLSDFDFGTNSTALVTVEMEIKCPPQSRANGMKLIAIDGGMDLYVSGEPDVAFASATPFGGFGGGPLDDDSAHSLVYQFSADQLTMWVDGGVIENKYDSVDLSPTGDASLYIGRAIDGWNELGYVGGIRLRITKAARYTHNEPITPPTWPVPTE